jgi:hypothetical protein
MTAALDWYDGAARLRRMPAITGIGSKPAADAQKIVYMQLSLRPPILEPEANPFLSTTSPRQAHCLDQQPPRRLRLYDRCVSPTLADMSTWIERTGQDHWRDLTTAPNELISRERIHDRIPVILSPADYGRWFDPGDLTRPLIDLLRPFPAEKMTCWQVGKDVGNVKIDRPDFIDLVPRELGLFAS